MPKNEEDSGKLIVAKGYKICPKSNKSPNLVTLVESEANRFWRSKPNEAGQRLGEIVNIKNDFKTTSWSFPICVRSIDKTLVLNILIGQKFLSSQSKFFKCAYLNFFLIFLRQRAVLIQRRNKMINCYIKMGSLVSTKMCCRL